MCDTSKGAEWFTVSNGVGKTMLCTLVLNLIMILSSLLYIFYWNSFLIKTISYFTVIHLLLFPFVPSLFYNHFCRSGFPRQWLPSVPSGGWAHLSKRMYRGAGLPVLHLRKWVISKQPTAVSQTIHMQETKISLMSCLEDGTHGLLFIVSFWQLLLIYFNSVEMFAKDDSFSAACTTSSRD